MTAYPLNYRSFVMVLSFLVVACQRIVALPIEISSTRGISFVDEESRILKDEWKSFEAFENCPEELSAGRILYRRELADITFQLMYDWAEKEELFQNSLTPDELERALNFEDLPIELQTEFLNYVCLHDDACDTVENLPFPVQIPMGELGKEAEKIAENLCSLIALNFNSIFMEVQAVTDPNPVQLTMQPTIAPSLHSSLSPSLTPTTFPTTQQPTLGPTKEAKVNNKEDANKIKDTENVVDSEGNEGDENTVDTQGNETVESIKASEDGQILVFSFSFIVRLEGSNISYTNLVSLSEQIENELEKKTMISLGQFATNRRRLRIDNDHRKLASFVDAKVRSLSSTECIPRTPKGNIISCFQVESEIAIDPEGENPEDVVAQVQNGIKEGEEIGAFFAYLPGLVGIEPDEGELIAAAGPTLVSDEKNNKTMLIIIFASLLCGILILLLVIKRKNVRKRRRRIKKTENNFHPETNIKNRSFEFDENNDSTDVELEVVAPVKEPPKKEISSVVIYEGNISKKPVSQKKSTYHSVPRERKYGNYDHSTLANPYTITPTSESGITKTEDTVESSLPSSSDSEDDEEEATYDYSHTTNSERLSTVQSTMFSYSLSSQSTKQKDLFPESFRNVFGVLAQCASTNDKIENENRLIAGQKSHIPTRSLFAKSTASNTTSPECKEDIEVVLRIPGASNKELEKVVSPGSIVKYTPTSTISSNFADDSDSEESKTNWKNKLGLKKSRSSDNVKLLTTKIKSDSINEGNSGWKITNPLLKKNKEPTSSTDLDKAYDGDGDDGSLDSCPLSPIENLSHIKEVTPMNDYNLLWKSAYDENSGDVYYYHTVTHATQWNKPDSFKEVNENITEKSYITKNVDTQLDSRPNVVVEFANGDDEDKMIDSKKNKIAVLLQCISPDEHEANQALIHQYEGREDELIMQLEELVVLTEQAPFDEPSVVSLDNISLKNQQPPLVAVEAKGKQIDVLSDISASQSMSLTSPQNRSISVISGISNSSSQNRPNPTGPSLSARIQTASTGVLSRHSRFSNATEKISNMRRFNPQPTTSSYNEESSLSSIESKGDGYKAQSNIKTTDELPRVDEIFEEPVIGHVKNRNLEAQHYRGSQYKLKSEKYKPRDIRKARRRRGLSSERNIKLNSSFEEKIAADNGGGDDASSVSELSAPTLDTNDSHNRGRAKVRLRKAIKNKDWERASSVAESLRSGDESSYSGMSAQSASYRRPKEPPQVWTQSELDKRIAENDWDSVFKYVAVMNKAKNKGNKTSRDKFTNTQPTKRFGARSQLQHSHINVSRTVSRSFSEDDITDDEFFVERQRRAV